MSGTRSSQPYSYHVNVPSFVCTRCHIERASRAGHCEACIAAERDARMPYAKVACDALEQLGYLDMVCEVRRRMRVFDALPFAAELERLTDG